MTERIHVGDTERLTMAFTLNAVPTDPAVVLFTMREPDGSATRYTYGTDAALVKDSTGVYHVVWTVKQGGVHYFRFEGSSPNQVFGSADEASFAALRRSTDG